MFEYFSKVKRVETSVVESDADFQSNKEYVLLLLVNNIGQFLKLKVKVIK